MNEGNTIGKVKWGTFIIWLFILATIASGIYTVYKRYNTIKQNQNSIRLMENHEGVIYHRLM